MKKWITILITILVVGTASALLVNYLSNKAEVDVDVTSPLSNAIEGDSMFNVFGGEAVAFNVTTENLATVPITGTLTNEFSNSLGLNCSDFSTLTMETFLNNVSQGVVDLLLTCNIIDNSTVSIGNKTKTWTVSEVEKNVYVGTFQPNAIGTYTFTSQVLI